MQKIRNKHGKIHIPMRIVSVVISAVLLVVLGLLNPWLMAIAVVVIALLFVRKK